MGKERLLWCLDVDGVLSDPKQKAITEPEILERLCERLEKGDLIALNTGRSIAWLEENIWGEFSKELARRELDTTLFCVGEKGAVYKELSPSSFSELTRDTAVGVPARLAAEIRQIVSSSYSDVSFFDESKKSMVSIEMLDGLDPALFEKRTVGLAKEIERLLANHHELRLERSVIALDVQHQRANKRSGAERVLAWLNEPLPDRVICVGDSLSDFSMVEPFLSSELPTHFSYVGVGDHSWPESNPLLTVTYSSVPYCRGFLETLQTAPWTVEGDQDLISPS